MLAHLKRTKKIAQKFGQYSMAIVQDISSFSFSQNMATRLAPDPGKARRHSSSVVHRTADAGRVGGITLLWLLLSNLPAILTHNLYLPAILTQILVLEQACPSAPAFLSPKSPRQWPVIDTWTVHTYIMDTCTMK